MGNGNANRDSAPIEYPNFKDARLLRNLTRSDGSSVQMWRAGGNPFVVAECLDQKWDIFVPTSALLKIDTTL